MKKRIDLNKTVYDLCQEYGEVKDIMKELGFEKITSPLAISTVGKTVTPVVGSRLKNIPFETIVAAFEANGFEVIGYESEDEEGRPIGEEIKDARKTAKQDRVEKLGSYIQRLHKGESLEAVKEDFVANFSDVSAAEIADAEQELLHSGVPLTEVKQLCDVHSALFHETPMKKVSSVEGHPVHTFMLENRKLEEILSEVEAANAAGDKEALAPALAKLFALRVHYAKKDALLFPLLSAKSYPGPSEVMWAVEDDLLDELKRLTKTVETAGTEAYMTAMKNLTTRIREMIYKEENILFPLAEENFSQEEWMRIYRDLPEFGPAFIEALPLWPEAEAAVLPEVEHYGKADSEAGLVRLPGGSMNLQQLRAVFNTIPAELTFADENEITRFVNEAEERIFKRPQMALGREMYSCHPPRVIPMVKQVIATLKSGKQDVVTVYKKIMGKDILVRYFAVRDAEGVYLGVLEVVEDLTDFVGGAEAGKPTMHP